jgi:hypothetical protein
MKEAKQWMEANPDAAAEDLEVRQVEFSSTGQPIISSIFEGVAGGEQERTVAIMSCVFHNRVAKTRLVVQTVQDRVVYNYDC